MSYPVPPEYPQFMDEFVSLLLGPERMEDISLSQKVEALLEKITNNDCGMIQEYTEDEVRRGLLALFNPSR